MLKREFRLRKQKDFEKVFNRGVYFSEKFLMLKLPSTFFYCSEDRLVNHKWLESLSINSLTINFIKKQSSSHMVPLEKSFLLSESIKEWAKE